MSDISPELESAISKLRELGWTVCPPPTDPALEPREGQVWRSPNPRIEDRMIVRIGSHRHWPEDGPYCVHYTSLRRQPDPEWGPVALSPKAWAKWVKQSNARPVEVSEGQ